MVSGTSGLCTALTVSASIFKSLGNCFGDAGGIGNVYAAGLMDNGFDVGENGIIKDSCWKDSVPDQPVRLLACGGRIWDEGCRVGQHTGVRTVGVSNILIGREGGYCQPLTGGGTFSAVDRNGVVCGLAIEVRTDDGRNATGTVGVHVEATLPS